MLCLVYLNLSFLRMRNEMAATSCESRRSSVYSEDLRWRMVYQKEGMGLSYAEVAKNLNVDQSTVKRVVKLFIDSGNVTKKCYDKSSLPRKIMKVVQFCILQLVLQYPGIKLREIKSEVNYLLQVELDESTICRFLHSQGLTRQKMRIVAKQRNYYERAMFEAEMSIYNPEMLIFLDETGCDRRNLLRCRAYSFRGKPAVSHKLLVRGKHMNAIAFVSKSGVTDCHIEDGSIDGDQFHSCVQKYLLPHLMPFDGINPHSVVIMDNASIHHINEVVQMIQGVGAMVIFLPPYSPDYNPIEEPFSKVKTVIKDYESSFDSEGMDLEDIILSSFSSITREDCIHWIEHCGIYM